MSANNSITLVLRKQLDEVYDVLYKQGLGLNHAEPHFKKILSTIKSDKEARRWWLEMATSEIVSGGTPVLDVEKRPDEFIDSDLICFIAHATRWDELRKACALRMASDDYINSFSKSRDMANIVRDALENNWEDKDFYQTFSLEQDATQREKN